MLGIFLFFSFSSRGVGEMARGEERIEGLESSQEWRYRWNHSSKGSMSQLRRTPAGIPRRKRRQLVLTLKDGAEADVAERASARGAGFEPRG